MGYNLSEQASALLDKVQNLFGANNVTVTSGGRSAAYNATIAGASSRSQHIGGNAFDFVVHGMTPAHVQEALVSSGLTFGQSIQEYGAGMGPRNHLGVGTAGKLSIGKDGRYTLIGYAPSTNADNPGGGVGGYASAFLNKGVAGIVALGSDIASGKTIDNVVASLDPSTWFKRIAFGVLAIVLIAIALFMLSGKSVSDVAAKVPPVLPI